MALDYWKLNGLTSSFNPLTTSFSNGVNKINDLPIGSWTVNFYAYSPTNQPIGLKLDSISNTYVVNQPLTNTRKFYTFTFNNPADQTFYIKGFSPSSTDIVIDSIQVVKTPLSKLTVNGIDGFLSGKWTLSSDTVILDDATIQINATSAFKQNILTIPCLPNTQYTFTCIKNVTSAYWYVVGQDANKTVIQNPIFSTASLAPGTISNTFITSSNVVFLEVHLTNADLTGNPFVLSKPILNLGSTPAAYNKKTGDKMVTPTAKKNLVSQNNFTIYAPNTTNVIHDEVIYGLIPNKPYTLSGIFPTGITVQPRKISDGSSYGNMNGNGSFIKETITPTETSLTMRVYSNGVAGTFNIQNLQLEQSSVATPYTPYAVQTNKKPQRTNANGQSTVLPSPKGLSFNGVSDSITLPDSNDLHLNTVSVECMVNLSQLKDYGVLFHKGEGGSVGNFGYALWTYGSGNTNFIISNGTTSYSTGITASTPTNQWIHLVGTYDGNMMYLYLNGVQKASVAVSTLLNQLSSNAYIGRYQSGINASPNGSIKYVNIYNRALSPTEVSSRYNTGLPITNGLVRNYDFTNAQNIVGNQVIPNAKNLIPSLEDSSWSIHANAKVLGKDTLHLDASSGSYSKSYIPIYVLPNTNYQISISGNGYYCVTNLDLSTNILGWTQNNTRTFNSGNNTTINIVFANFLSVAMVGQFDFIRPQLYQLTGNEGTINGTPKQLNKPKKRSLYAKR